jgi:hypothetical protein
MPVFNYINVLIHAFKPMNWDSWVSKLIEYRQNESGLILGRVKNFSLHHRIQTGSGAHPASYPMGTKGSFPGGKAVGA